ncbi:MAG: DnaJ domain-containing protein [Pseudomonadota bacterium]
MAKIHTHYDNLKVSRMAPQEVIRAAYKALSQKYHPDKNPGDEKAARIMAIVNSAYGTLSDPQRRKEHDEWIAAEEWEVEWLESTHNEDGRERQRGEADGHGWTPEPVDAGVRRAGRGAKWWFAFGGVFAGGCVAGALITAQPKLLSSAFASALGGKAEAQLERKPELKADIKTELKAETHAVAKAEARPDPALEGWAVTRPSAAQTFGEVRPDIKALAVSQVTIAARAPDCDSEPHSLVAPNGEAWPQQSGYVGGYPVNNRGDDMALTVDNSANASPVFVKVFDLDQRASVRYVYVLAHDTLAVDKLAAGKYELRYQNLDVGADSAECAARKSRTIKQADAG